jgi:hypothetical protein
MRHPLHLPTPADDFQKLMYLLYVMCYDAELVAQREQYKPPSQRMMTWQSKRYRQRTRS